MTITLPEIGITAVCHTCRLRHRYQVPITQLDQASMQWESKHPRPGHRIEYSAPQPLYEGRWRQRLREFWTDTFPRFAPLGYAYGDNADAKVTYNSSAAYTLTLTSLATSATRVVGRESTTIDNTSVKALDYIAALRTKTGGSAPTVNTLLDCWVHGSMNDTPTYVSPLTGADAGATFPSENTRNSAMILGGQAVFDAATARVMDLAPFSIGSRFGAAIGLPKFHGLFVSHNAGQNLSSTAGDHVASQTSIYGTIA